MKRGAEKQLTKGDEEEIEEVEGTPGGFKKASETVLATRSIRPLPGRTGKAAPKPIFAGFGTLPTANPFASSTDLSSSSTSAFGSTPAAPTKSAFSSTPTPTSTSAFPSSVFTPSSTTSTATNTSKAFASIIGSSNSVFANPTSSSQQSAAASTAPTALNPGNGVTESELTKYYTNLRGLNASLLNTVTNTIEGDPFSDLTSLLESYKAMRVKVQKSYDESPDKGDKSNSNPDSSTSSSKPSMPSVPPSFSGFGQTSSSSSTSTSTNAPSMASVPLTFTGFGKQSSPPDSNPAASAFGSLPTFNPFASSKNVSSPAKPAPPSSTNIFGGPSTPTSSLLFGGSSSQPSTTSTTTPGSSAAPFTPAHKSATTDNLKPNPFALSSTSTTSNPFGSSSSTSSAEKPPFSFGAPPTTSFAPPASNPFGTPSTNIFGSSTASSSLPFKIEPSTTTSVFGAPVDATSPGKDKKPSPSIGFGLPSPHAKNTGVFFGFGGAPPTSGSSASSTSTPAAAPPDKESQETTITEEGSDAGSSTMQSSAEPKESTPGLLTPNPHDEEGAGEENEETLHSVKLKAYRMKKAEEQGGPGWAELGMGILRLKKDKDSGSRRLLLRNSTNGKINMNFKIYSGLKPSISKKALTFVGHFEGASQTYCVRLPNEVQATDLKKALDREIEFVKAKES